MTLVHDAFVYDSDDVFVAEMECHLDAGLRAGATVVAITTQHNVGLLREALAADEDRIVYIDRDEWYRHPPHVLAGFDRVLRVADASGSPFVCAIGEVRFGTTPREWARWTAYEATVDRALAGRNLQVVCPYDARVLPEQVLEGAWMTHAHVVADGRRESPAYEAAERVVRAHTPERSRSRSCARCDRPPTRATCASSSAAASQPRTFRITRRRTCCSRRARSSRTPGSTAAARRRCAWGASARMSSVRSPTPVAVSTPPDGYVPPAPTNVGGAGLWVARQTTSAVELLRPRAAG